VTADRFWLALVTVERTAESGNILPQWAIGACGWMVALAPDFETACRCLVRDLASHQLRLLETDHEQEVIEPDDVGQFDQLLAKNWREIEPHKQTIFGTLYGYKGEGEA
jgi:hypothetical protein